MFYLQKQEHKKNQLYKIPTSPSLYTAVWTTSGHLIYPVIQAHSVVGQNHVGLKAKQLKL